MNKKPLFNSNKICFSVLFNHRYDQNIPILKKLYSNRFTTLRFLIPFIEWSHDSDIIPIIETSVHFQGYFTQAFKHLPDDSDYYIFCADDLIINPAPNENNIIDSLNCRDAGYIKYLNPISEHSFAWHKFDECVKFPPDDCVVPYTSLLPSYNEIISAFTRHNIRHRRLGLHNFLGVHNKGITCERIKAGLSYLFRNGLNRYISFPLVEGFSDLIVIPGHAWRKFAYFCGIFAALNLWVDTAIATAMVLSHDVIRTENDHQFKGIEVWGHNQQLPEKKHDLNLENLLSQFPYDQLHIHPIKLSRWKHSNDPQITK